MSDGTPVEMVTLVLTTVVVVVVTAITSAVVVVVSARCVVVTPGTERVPVGLVPGVPGAVVMVTSTCDVIAGLVVATRDNVEPVGGLAVVADVIVTSSQIVVCGRVTLSGNGGEPHWTVTAEQNDTAQ